jgi:hypothetical protein
VADVIRACPWLVLSLSTQEGPTSEKDMGLVLSNELWDVTYVTSEEKDLLADLTARSLFSCVENVEVPCWDRNAHDKVAWNAESPHGNAEQEINHILKSRQGVGGLVELLQLN